MSEEPKGSKPGPHILPRNNSIVGSLHPVSSPETAAPECHLHRSATSGNPAAFTHHDSTAEEEETPSSPTSITKDEVIYPEGGTRAWLVVLGSFSGMLAGFGYMNTIGIYQAYISSHQLAGYSESTIGWIFSVYIFLSFGCGVQIGPVFDAYGPRYLVLAGSVCLLLSVFLMSISTCKYCEHNSGQICSLTSI